MLPRATQAGSTHAPPSPLQAPADIGPSNLTGGPSAASRCPYRQSRIPARMQPSLQLRHRQHRCLRGCTFDDTPALPRTVTKRSGGRGVVECGRAGVSLSAQAVPLPLSSRPHHGQPRPTTRTQRHTLTHGAQSDKVSCRLPPISTGASVHACMRHHERVRLREPAAVETHTP